METVVVSSKYQVVIPAKIRETMHIKPGTKIQVFQFNNRIEFVPYKNVKKMRGFLQGIDTTVPREKDRV